MRRLAAFLLAPSPREKVLQSAMIIALLFVAIHGYRTQVSWLESDSARYLEYASALSDGSFFSKGEAPLGLVFRTPAYPALLVASQALSKGGSLLPGLLIVHFVVAAFALVCAIRAISRRLPPCIVGPLLVYPFYMAQEIYPAVMTEWSALSLIILLFGAWVSYLDSRSAEGFMRIILCASLLAAVRPVFLFVVPLSLMLGALPFARPERIIGRKVILYALAALSPLMLTGAASSYLSGHLFPPAGALSLFAVTSAIAPVELQPEDNETVKGFFEEVNEGRTQWKPHEDEAVNEERLFEAGVSNMQVAERVREGMRLSWDAYIEMLGMYSGRILRNERSRYFELVSAQLKPLLKTLVYLVPALLIPMVLLRDPKNSAVGLSVIVVLAIHLLQAAIVSFVGIVHSRYIALTELPLQAVSMIAAIVFLQSVIWKSISQRTGKPVPPGNHQAG